MYLSGIDLVLIRSFVTTSLCKFTACMLILLDFCAQFRALLKLSNLLLLLFCTTVIKYNQTNRGLQIKLSFLNKLCLFQSFIDTNITRYLKLVFFFQFSSFSCSSEMNSHLFIFSVYALTLMPLFPVQMSKRFSVEWKNSSY